MNHALIFVTLNVLACCFDLSLTYHQFQIKFSRTYQGQERDHHKTIFQNNIKKLTDLWRQGQDVQANNFTDWNSSQLAQLQAFTPDQANMETSQRPFQRAASDPVPENFNWKDRSVVSSVKAQRNCGACWAFVTASIYESLLSIETNSKPQDLSEQALIDCDSKSKGCEGGYPYQTMKMAVERGIPTQSEYLYQESSNYYSSRGYSVCEISRNRLKSLVKVVHYQTLTPSQIEADLVANGPLAVGIDSSNLAFMNAGPSGLINFCQNTDNVNHIVMLYGYNASHWFIKNSWGTAWANKGLAFISKSNDCGITSYIDEIQGVTVMSQPVTLVVKMTDSAGNGWNGYQIGLKQDSKIVGSFGLTFTDGSAYKPVEIAIEGIQYMQIVVVGKGSGSSEIGFQVLKQSGELIYERKPGFPFLSTARFLTFCPSLRCESPTQQITLIDSFGDGWTSTSLYLQDQKFNMIAIPDQSSKFSILDRIISIPVLQKVKIVAGAVDQWSSQIGFRIIASDGHVLYSRAPGQKFLVGDVLTTLCIGCSDVTTTDNSTVPVAVVTNQKDPYEIATYALSGVTALFLIIAIITTVMSVKQYKFREIPNTGTGVPNIIVAPMTTNQLRSDRNMEDKQAIGNKKTGTNLATSSSNIDKSGKEGPNQANLDIQDIIIIED